LLFRFSSYFIVHLPPSDHYLKLLYFFLKAILFNIDIHAININNPAIVHGISPTENSNIANIRLSANITIWQIFNNFIALTSI